MPFSAGHCDLTYWQARGTARRELPGATRLSFFQGYVLGTAALPLTDAPLKSLADGIAKGRVPSLLTKTFDFDQVPRAHAFMESERTLGKIVVRV